MNYLTHQLLIQEEIEQFITNLKKICNKNKSKYKIEYSSIGVVVPARINFNLSFC